MPSPPTLDIAELLAPIPGENPAGQSVRYDGTHDAIREARRADDALEQGDWVYQVKVAAWPAVIEMATEALTTKSKDLQITVWLVEALVKQHGFAGLRDGLQLLQELQERFWPSLYPAVEDDDLEPRVAPLAWLNERLPPSIREVPLTQSIDGQNYSWWRWEESRAVDNEGRRDQEALAAALAEGKITGEQFDKAVEATSPGFYKTLFEDLNQTWEEYERLDRVVEEKFGREAPSLLELKQALEGCRMLIREIAQKKGGLEPAPTPREPEPTPAAVAEREPEPSPAPQLRSQAAILVHQGAVPLEPQNRADALCRLAAVGDYFRKTEPHSPVAYLVQRAVRWGEMPLDEWLQDVIHDENVLGQLREMLGMKDADNGTSNASG
jgi:type VI secretion system protein ImpA